MIAAILLAGGVGSRMADTTPKQFLQLGEKKIIQYSVDLFCQSNLFEEIILVCSPQYQNLIQINAKKNVLFAEPGKERKDSVLNALNKVSKKSTFVCIHDTARPLVREENIEELIKAAKQYGAAALGVPIKSTLKKVQQGFIQCTLDRSQVWETQTPQMMRKDWLQEGYRSIEKEEVTDDVFLLEKLGKQVKLIFGSYSNIKITTKEDLAIANYFLQQTN